MADSQSLTTDILIVGGGVAGLSAASALAPQARVLVLERESQPAYHTSGRSAAMYIEAYENDAVHALTCASLAFFEDPDGQVEGGLLSPRGAVMVASAAQVGDLEANLARWQDRVPQMQRIDVQQAREMAPVVRPEWLAGASWDPSIRGIDVHELLQCFQRTLRAHDGSLRCASEVVSLRRKGALWIASLADGTRIEAAIVVNAAGAWASEIGVLGAATPVPLEPRRRTALLIDPPEDFAAADRPMVYSASGDLYFKPEAGQLMVSPADETPSSPCDARPDELDVALTVERLEQRTTIEVRRIPHQWAGLRTFAPDRRPIVGMDPNQENFFWLAGQGGCGVQTAPAMGALVAGLIVDGAVPEHLRQRGVTAEEVGPGRFTTGT